MILHQAENLVLDLMYQHGLTQQGWRFKFDNAVRRLGQCKHAKRIITLARHATLVNDSTAVKKTILHEIAHALCGFHEGHGPVWKAKCLEIGGDGQRLGNIAVRAPHKYKLFCVDCTYTWKYYRKPKLGPCYIHKCAALLKRIGYIYGQPWVPVSSNLKMEVLA
jgi:hypothetical protein